MDKPLFENIAENVSYLLRNSTPDFQENSKDHFINFLIHNKLDSYGSFIVENNSIWKEQFSESEINQLSKRYSSAKLKRQLAIQTLSDAQVVLKDCNPLLFKGLALSHLYPDPALRDPGDIDIIVPTDSFFRACKNFEKSGWILQPSIHRDRPFLIAEKHGFAQVYKHPELPVIVDLHRAPVDKTEPFWIDPKAMFQRERKVQISDSLAVNSLSLENHLILITLHSIRHGAFRVGWCFDVFRACKEWKNELDLEYFYSQVKRYNLTKAVRVGFEIANAIFEMEWHPFIDYPKDKSLRKSIVRRSPEVIIRGHLTKPGSWRRIIALIDLIESNSHKISYIANTLFPARELFQTTEKSKPDLLEYFLGRLKAVGNLTK